jgi:hypothetical protein
MPLETSLAGRRRQWVVILSPIGVIALGNSVQRVAGLAMGAWAWLPTMLVFWAAIAGIISWDGRDKPARGWLPARGVAVGRFCRGVGLLSVRSSSGRHVLESPNLLAPGWCSASSTLLKSAWRGRSSMPPLIRLGRGRLSTVLFALSHP